MEKILEQFDLDFDDLKPEERETLNGWLSNLEKNQITVEGIKGFVGHLKDTVEQELVETPEFTYIFIFKVPNRKQIYLKARLRNLMLIEAFLTGPEKARKAIERQLEAIK